MYDYTLAFHELEQMLADGLIDKETYEDTIASLEGDAKEKAQNLAYMIDNFTAHAEMLKEEAKKLREKAKTIENKIEWLENSLEQFFRASGHKEGDTLQVGIYRLGYRKLPDKVEITDEEKIPEAFLVPQKPKVDKRGISKALKDGEEVPGVYLETERYGFRVQK